LEKIFVFILVMTIITSLLVVSNVVSDDTFAQSPTSNNNRNTSKTFLNNITVANASIQQAPPVSPVNATTVINSIFDSSLPQVFIIVIFLVIIIPVVLDMYLAYTRKPKGSTERAVGMSGLYRALMTFGVLLLMGTVIFYVLALITLNLDQSTSPVLQSLIDLLKNLGTILGTALATIIAFYFGMRGAETAAEKGAAAAKPAVDKEPPKVLNTLPSDGAAKVPVNSLVSATFSESMSSPTINNTAFTVKKDGDATPSITGTISLGPDGKTVVFDTTEDFSPNTKYVATINTEAKDLAGNALVSTKSWSFTTA
jgi:Big-like domain-containing protein